MPWHTIAAVNSVPELKAIKPPIDDIPAGTPGIVAIDDLPYWLAKSFDLAFAEQTLGDHLAPAHARVTDCYEQDGIAYVEFEVIGSPAIPIILALAAALAILAVSAAVITVAVNAPDEFFEPEGWSESLSSIFRNMAIPLGIAVAGVGMYLLSDYKKDQRHAA